jgi:hypothetical protein
MKKHSHKQITKEEKYEYHFLFFQKISPSLKKIETSCFGNFDFVVEFLLEMLFPFLAAINSLQEKEL